MCREPQLKYNPGFWLSRIKAAAGEPLKVLKSDSDKLTLKTRLEPWGEVCLQDMEWHGLKKKMSLFRRTSGRITWDLAAALADQDIPVVEQLLYLEIREKGFVVHTCQVSRWLQGYNLGQMARERTDATEDLLITVLEKAALLIARLHRAGFIHGDLKWSNFLYAPEYDKGIILADLDHVRSTRSSSALGRDLARFILSATEFAMEKKVEEKLMKRYFEEFRPDTGKVGKILNRHLSRKREKYAKRGASTTDFNRY